MRNVSQERLAEATQTSFHVLDEAAPVFTPLDIPGLRGRIGPSTNPQLNAVGMARLDEATADAVIREVIARFSAEGKPFGWLVGPDSTPTDIGSRLEAVGMEKFGEAAGMALTDLTRPIGVDPTVRIDEVSFADLRGERDLIAKAFGHDMTSEDAAVMVDALDALHDRYDTRGYLAFIDDEPVGFSTMSNTHVPGVVWLVLTATREEYRGRGIYRSFVARRIADACADVAAAAVMQAIRETSAPICATLGFTEVAALELYAWMPADM